MAAFSSVPADDEYLLSTVFKYCGTSDNCMPSVSKLDSLHSHLDIHPITHPPPSLFHSPNFFTVPSNAANSIPQYFDSFESKESHFGIQSSAVSSYETGLAKMNEISNGKKMDPGPLISNQPVIAWSCSNGENEKERAVRGRPRQMKSRMAPQTTMMNRRSSSVSQKASKEKQIGEPAESPNKLAEPEPGKDFVLVRARRGQATDRHSIAERVRREKIRKRMRFLQELVPGCRKATGKTVILDEIINYIKSLQNQIEKASAMQECGRPLDMTEHRDPGKSTSIASNQASLETFMDIECLAFADERNILNMGAGESDVQLESFVQQLLRQQ